MVDDTMDRPDWMIDTIETQGGEVPLVNTQIGLGDRIGGCCVRWNIGRDRYLVEPGLYGVGTPTSESPVLVTANYKLTFDVVRAQLQNKNVWLLVLDTKGVNVWCAAGKGTFGTEELIQRVAATRLDKVVTHRHLILPQLGATGISAHEVCKACGWQVVYGPVRINDLSAYLDADGVAAPEMRRVRFTLWDRLVVVPVELSIGFKYFVGAVLCFLLLSGISRQGYSLETLQIVGIQSLLFLLLAYLAGTVLTPALLPWIPGAAFAFKGTLVGLVVFWAAMFIPGGGLTGIVFWAWLLFVPAASSFFAMNFTGASTYTSLAGVQREMRIAVPVQGVALIVGLLLWLVGRFI